MLSSSKGFNTLKEAQRAGHEVVIDTLQSEVVTRVVRNEKLIEERKGMQ